MSVDIPSEFDDFIRQELASGQYQSEADVVCQGLLLLQERRRRLEELRKDINAGLQQIERGEVVEIEDEQSQRAFFEDIKARGRKRLETQ